VPSHWTPYLRVDDVDTVVQRAVALGGEVIVHPFVVDGTARIALILDGVGAHVGLWEPIGSDRGEENAHD
jgi:predicted enzyme related to lactoylglutathione lyase